MKHSYFKNADGEIHTVSPWRLCEYRAALQDPDWSHFHVDDHRAHVRPSGHRRGNATNRGLAVPPGIRRAATG
ncbi:hypothetical protein C6A85_09960 [Mycobacterium sp. ITM-2017-0098]|nr:hypothetical protein C6A85_09960 [Mycobacterium sp. ITM-2017-0098]